MINKWLIDVLSLFCTWVVFIYGVVFVTDGKKWISRCLLNDVCA